MADRPTPNPQSEATLAAFSGGVIIQTDDGHWVALSPKLARKLAEELPELALAAENAAVDRERLGFYPSVMGLKPGTHTPI
jgi:hypothetical protein